jgi:hypothetical protein
MLFWSALQLGADAALLVVFPSSSHPAINTAPARIAKRLKTITM